MKIEAVAYRGEHGEETAGATFHTRQQALSFGSAKSARTYAKSPNNTHDQVTSPRLFKVKVAIENPFVNQPDDPFLEFSDIRRALGDERALAIAFEAEDHLMNTDNFNELLDDHSCDTLGELSEIMGETLLDSLYVDAYVVLDQPEVIEDLREAGYDGAVHGGNGETAFEAEYKVFDHAQAQVLWVKSLSQSAKMSPGPSL